MRAKSLACCAAVLAVLFPLVFSVLHAWPPGITVTHVNTFHSGGTEVLTFAVTNHTHRAYIFRPLSMGVRSGSTWKDFLTFDTNQIPDVVSAGGSVSVRIEVTNRPAGLPLLLKLSAQRELGGLAAVRSRVFRTFVPLPGKAGPWFEVEQFPVTSEPFVEPETSVKPKSL